MSKDEHPINLIYEGIADLLTEKGEIINVVGDELWKVISINYGGYTYNITKHHGVIVMVARIKDYTYIDTDSIKRCINTTYGIPKENPFLNELEKATAIIRKGNNHHAKKEPDNQTQKTAD